MKIAFDNLTMTLLAALGLELGALGCTSDGQQTSAGETGTTAADTSTGTTSIDETGTDATGTETGTETDGMVEFPYDCENPVAIMQLGTDVPSGFYECADGFIHRGEAVECVDPQGPGDSLLCEDVCQADVDCVAKPYGNCAAVNAGFECACVYGCATDADCDPGYICSCPGVARDYATCIAADCITTNNCTDGLCGLNKYYDTCAGGRALACTGPEDTCHVAADCEPLPCEVGEDPVAPECTAYGGQPYTCRPHDCPELCGRPFVVDGTPRVAEPIARADWRAAGIRVRSIDAATRRRLAEHWTRIAQYEHASIASFARAATDLLALGAPPTLILATRSALADEIEHARLVFALASAYAEQPIGPGPLAIDGALASHSDAREVIEGLIIEACVGETLAAIEVQEAASWAEDPTVAALLERIAADELRHAALGWRSLRWTLDRGDASLRAFAFERLDAALRDAQRADPSEGVPPALRAHGVLDDELREQVRCRALAHSIGPCVAALRTAFGFGEALEARV